MSDQPPPTDITPHNNTEQAPLVEILAACSLNQIDFTPLSPSLSQDTLRQLKQQTMNFLLGKLEISEFQIHVYCLKGEQRAVRKFMDKVLESKKIILSILEAKDKESEQFDIKEGGQQKPLVEADAKGEMRKIYTIAKVPEHNNNHFVPSQEEKKQQKRLVRNLSDDSEPLKESLHKIRLPDSRQRIIIDQPSSEGQTSGVVVDLVSEKSEEGPAEPLSCEKKIEEPVPESEVEKKQPSLASSESLKKKVKCKFYPRCNRKDCKYFHPSEKCKFFPKCKYGANCINVHPECKFGDHCTRRDCYYSHPKQVYRPKPKPETIPTALSHIMQSIAIEKLRPKKKQSEQSKPQ